MAETPGNPQAGASAEGQQPPAGDPKDPASQETTKTTFQDDLSGLTPDELKERLLAETGKRAEAVKAERALRERIAAFEKAEEERKKAAMTEVERAKAEKAEADKVIEALRSKNLDLVIQGIARDLGFKYADDGTRFIDRSKLKIDASGEPENAKELLEEILKLRPELKSGGGVPATDPSNPRGGASPAAKDAKVKEAVDMFPALRNRVTVGDK
jgi:hypothetical protein